MGKKIYSNGNTSIIFPIFKNSLSLVIMPLTFSIMAVAACMASGVRIPYDARNFAACIEISGVTETTCILGKFDSNRKMDSARLTSPILYAGTSNSAKTRLERTARIVPPSIRSNSFLAVEK